MCPQCKTAHVTHATHTSKGARARYFLRKLFATKVAAVDLGQRLAQRQRLA
jgi:hypothetical protein